MKKMMVCLLLCSLLCALGAALAETPAIELYDWKDFTLALFEDDEDMGLTHENARYDAFVLNSEDIRANTSTDPSWSMEVLTETDAVIAYEVMDGYPELCRFIIEEYPDAPTTAKIEMTCTWAGQTASQVYTFDFVVPDGLPTGTTIPGKVTAKVGEQYDLDMDFTPSGYSFGSTGDELAFGFDIPRFFHWGSNYAMRTFSIVPEIAGIWPCRLNVLSSNMVMGQDVLIYVYEEDGSAPYGNALDLPDDLITIEEEAFLGVDAQRVDLPNGLKTIESHAFAECEALGLVVLPDSVTSIADDAFEGSEDNLLFCCNEDSYAREYAYEHEFMTISPEDLM